MTALVLGFLLSTQALSAETIYSKYSRSVATVSGANKDGVDIGTGFLIAEDTLATANHVVANAKTVTITFPDRPQTELVATILAKDTVNDVALLRIRKVARKPLTLNVAPLPKPGASVFVLASPEFESPAISTGIVSKLKTKEPRSLVITAPIAAGWSGSPVLDKSGSVVGMVVNAFDESQPLNGCVPALEILQTGFKDRG